MSLALPVTLNDVNYDAAAAFILGGRFKVVLSVNAIKSDDGTLSDLTEVSPGSGYSAGGPETVVTAHQDGSAAYLLAEQVTITASGGTIGPFNGFAIYDVDSEKLLGAYNEPQVIDINGDLVPADIIIANGSSRTLQFNQLTGFLRWGSVVP